MTITPPANVNYGRVVWQALSDVTDGPDSGTRPDFIAPTGKVTFVASTVVERNATASPNPVSILRDPIVGVLDSEGYLCTPNDAGEPDYRGVDLIATDDPDLNPTDWVYNVSYAVKGKNGRQIALQPHQIYVPTDAVVDLTTVGPVDNATAIGIPQAEALAAQAAAAAEDASVAASQALAAAAAAEAALADVDSTTAGNLAEPTSETSAATKALVASDIEAGGPVGDAVSAQIDDAVLPVSQQATRTAKAVFNVIDYGATLDGVADDTAALQEAINAAQALAKRACIRIPFGEAKTTGVSITSPFIDLEGPGALRGTLTIGTTTHQAMYCTVRNVRFVKSTGNDDGTGTNTAGNGIELMSVEKVNIEGCQFVGHDAAINIPAFTPTTGSAQQTMQISISSCTFWWTNYALKGRIVSGGSWMSIADIDISDCLQVLTYISAVDLASCDGLKISGSTFFCKGNPYQYKQQNIKVGRTSWVAITGNNLFEPGREAIALTDPGSFSITGNTIAWPGEYVPSDAISITLSSSYTSVGSISGNMASQFTKNLVGIYGSGNASGITIGVNSFTVSAVPQPSYYGPTAHPTS